MRKQKSSIEIWWYCLSDEQKEIVREIGKVTGMILALVIIGFMILFLPYVLIQLNIL